MASRCTCSWRVSSTDASLAAVSAPARSAMASSNRPPLAWLSRPGCSTGCPRLSVAARSSPPSSALSLAPWGRRRSGVPAGSSACRRSSQAWRQGPAAARRQAPPRPTGSMASKAAAKVSSWPRGQAWAVSGSAASAFMAASGPVRRWGGRVVGLGWGRSVRPPWLQPGCALAPADSGRCSASARSTRVLEPVSSSTWRRRRWRRAEGAT